MKKLAVAAAFTIMSLTSMAQGVENLDDLQSISKRCSRSHHHHNRLVPVGSFFVEEGENPQQLPLSDGPFPISALLHFNGTNVACGVKLSLSGNTLVVPRDGNYKIEWNASLTLDQGISVEYHFDLRKNGITLLNPSPQALDIVYRDENGHTVAASVIVPLLENDEISLLWTIDGSEGENEDFGIAEVVSAQISASWLSEICN